MATYDFKLLDPPSNSRKYELWLQHRIGFTLVLDVRDYALQQIDRFVALAEAAN